jgi:uncharacterized YigZ family protein
VATRSRFLAMVAPVGDEAEALAVVAARRRAHHDARHHVTALRLGPQGDVHRADDDGEPAGTGGAPALAVLDGAALTDVVAVVTRWFGGTLLGAGGLVRAYGGAVGAALDGATRVGRREVRRIEVAVDHASAGRLEHRLRGWAAAVGGEVTPGRYGARDVRIEVAAPPARLPELEAELAAWRLAAPVDLGSVLVRAAPRGDPRGPRRT